MSEQQVLSEFCVVYEAGDFSGRGTLVHAYDGRQLVLTAIPRETLEDFFRTESFTTKEQCLVADRNIEAFAAIIESKYRRRDFTTFEKYGQTYPYIVISLADMENSGLAFTASVVEMARQARFVAA